MLWRPYRMKGVASEAVHGPSTLVADWRVQRLVSAGQDTRTADATVSGGAEQELVNVPVCVAVAGGSRLIGGGTVQKRVLVGWGSKTDRRMCPSPRRWACRNQRIRSGP